MFAIGDDVKIVADYEEQDADYGVPVVGRTGKIKQVYPGTEHPYRVALSDGIDMYFAERQLSVPKPKTMKEALAQAADSKIRTESEKLMAEMRAEAKKARKERKKKQEKIITEITESEKEMTEKTKEKRAEELISKAMELAEFNADTEKKNAVIFNLALKGLTAEMLEAMK